MEPKPGSNSSKERSGLGSKLRGISGGKDNRYSPPPTTIAMFLATFILVSFLSWTAVKSANNSRDDTRQDLVEANIRIGALQEQLDCINRITLIALKGQLGNSIVQDNLLLASTSGGDREEIRQQLSETRAELISLSQEIDGVDKECT
jgi:hypothetical protein